MLIGEINGMPAATHPAARIFVEEGFAATAMGLQARLRLAGIGIATAGNGGGTMAEQRRNTSEETLEHDRDLQEREAIESTRNRGNDEAMRGEDLGDVDPDSPESENDRDDLTTDE
jgi:hypothetical protein